MNRQRKISVYFWLVIYAIGASVINGLLMLNDIDAGPWLIVMGIPPVILALLYPPVIYHTSLFIFAINLFASRIIWPTHVTNRFDWASYLGLFTLTFIVELTGFLSRRQQQLLHNLAQTESELRQQKSFLQLVLDSSPNLISVRDRDDNYVLANAAVSKLLNKPTEEIINQRFSDLYRNREIVEESLDENRHVFDSGETQYLPERRLYDKDGQLHWFQVTKSPLRDSKGNVSHVLIVADEITRQKLVSEELQTNNRLFRALTQSTQYLLEDNFEIALNKTLTALGQATGTDCIFITENVGQGESMQFVVQSTRMWLKAPPPSDQNAQFPLEMPYFPTFARLYGILSSGHMIRFEEMAESEKVWLATNSAQSFIGLPIQVDGKFWGSVCFLDWSVARQWQENECNILSVLTTMLGTAIARRNDWEELARQEQFTRHVLSALPVQIFVKDAEGRFVMANDEYSIAGNKVSGPVLGSTSSDLFGSESAKQYDEEDQYVIRTGQVYVSPVESYFITEGKERWRQIEKSPIRDANGKVTHIVGIQYDLTEQMEKNEELRKAKEAAEAATRAKSAFLANMSHEIRTPMNAVVGMTSLLTQTNLDDEQRECIETIRNSGEALLGILNKILDFSKIESEQLELEHQPFALIECLEQTLELFAHKAYEKGLELFLSITPGVPTYIYGDLVRLRQILSNLIDNAVKFTDTGDIVVSVSVEQNDMSHIYFSVSDNGIGLSQEEQQRLFLSFSQVDSSITRRYGGTGLGLAISKRLCELMGGRIWVSSSEQQGTTFHFTIAFEPVVEQPIWPGNHSPLSRKRILLIDGHPLIRKELRDLLELWGALVSVASSVSQATQLLTGPFYHLVIADLHMALTGGLKSALENQLERTTSETQILLLTKVGDPFNPAELQKSNNYSTLTKPIKPTELLARITSLTLENPNTRTARSRTQPALPINDTVKILLVEDNEINRKVALRLLQRIGYQAEVAANGEEAVNLLSRQRFDIVLMDAHMPVMGGLEATRRIRTLLPQPEQPYIIGITADALASFREECLDAGMDDYITKPMGIEDLSQALTRSLSAIALRKEPA